MFYDYPKLFDYDCATKETGDGSPTDFVGNYVEQANPKSMFELLKDDPKFKAFCARRINGKVAKPKRFKVPIPKPKGINSVLGEYTTGRLHCIDGFMAPETLKLKCTKRGVEFVSEVPLNDPLIEVPQGVANFWIDLWIKALELEQKQLKKRLERRAA